jgi:hypothetical protein
MSEDTVIDDRFDRRELLLHLGDILEALTCLVRIKKADQSVAQLVRDEESLQDFEFLRALEPNMTVTEFCAGVGSAFFLWPKALLELELNRNALASTVQHDLFAGNPDGWDVYVTHVQKKVSWFGTGLPAMKAGKRVERAHDIEKPANPLETPAAATSTAKRHTLRERKGWPWPEPKPKS